MHLLIVWVCKKFICHAANGETYHRGRLSELNHSFWKTNGKPLARRGTLLRRGHRRLSSLSLNLHEDVEKNEEKEMFEVTAMEGSCCSTLQSSPGCVGAAFRSVVDFCIIYQGCLVKRAVRVSRWGCRAWGLRDGATISDTLRQDD